MMRAVRAAHAHTTTCTTAAMHGRAAIQKVRETDCERCARTTTRPTYRSASHSIWWYVPITDGGPGGPGGPGGAGEGEGEGGAGGLGLGSTAFPEVEPLA